jgi:hypothetical protein
MLRTLLCFAAAAVVAAGCAIKQDEQQSQTKPDVGPAPRELSERNLQEIARAYREALKKSPPQNAEELRVYLKRGGEELISPRDQQPYEFNWGIDPSQLPQGGFGRLLAWEQTASEDGFRCTLLADCMSVVYANEVLFERMKARGTR